MLKTETRVIEGLSVTVTQFSALRSLRLMARLGGLLAPMLSALEMLDGVDLKSDIPLRQLQPLVMQLFETLTPETAVSLAGELLLSSSVIYEDRKVELNDSSRIDLVFGGNLIGLLKSLAFSIEVNYRDFFGGTPAAEPTPS